MPAVLTFSETNPRKSLQIGGTKCCGKLKHFYLTFLYHAQIILSVTDTHKIKISNQGKNETQKVVAA